MEAGKHIELSLGQSPGEFRLILDGIAISIHLNSLMGAPMGTEAAGLAAGNSVSIPVPPPQVAAALSGDESQDSEQVMAELNHYRQVSREIYEGLGKLAKDINLSIQDLSLAEIIQTAMGSPSEGLDQARSQVTDVLQMTEKATMSIMNLVDQIRDDCQSVQTKLIKLTAAEPLGEAEEFGSEAAPENSADQGLWEEVLAQAEELDQLLCPLAPPEVSPPARVPLFSLSDILQILLEFCTNEKVKQHLKAVQAKQDAIFRTAEAERAISLLAAGVPQEDGFHQLPVDPLLNILKDHCDDERVQDLLVKMASSATKLFPIAALPLEAQEMEEEFADEPGDPQGNPEAAALWEKLRQALHNLAGQRQTGVGAPAKTGHSQGAAEVQEVLGTVDRITGSLSRIVEALSFQDLSGQRLLKILNIIRQLQVQVLTLLVAAGQKLLVHIDDQPFDLQESDQARKELDRLLHSAAPPPDQESADPITDDQPLDQSAVNDLLTSMGF